MKPTTSTRSPRAENEKIPSVSEFSLTKVLATGELFLSAKRYDVAERLFKEALLRKSWSVRAFSGLGSIELARENFGTASQLFVKSLVRHPELKTGSTGIAQTFSRMDRFDEAAKWYRRALCVDPDNRAAKITLGITLLRLGRWHEGFVFYDQREDRERLAKSLGAHEIWDGSKPIAGKTIMVIGEQGFGDHINFVRYCKFLGEMGAQVLFFTRPELKTLIERIPFIDAVVCNGEKARFDAVVMAMSLPRIFGTDPNSVPLKQGYIPEIVQETSPSEVERVDGPIRIAIAWRGNPDNSRDRVRSCPFSIFNELIRSFPDIEFYCLPWDYDSICGDVPANFLQLDGAIASFDETANVLRQMHLVISVDTSLIHLAGALGRRAWLLLGRQPDWRWLAEGSSGVWYDSVRVFRSPNGWPELMGMVKDALNDEIAESRKGRLQNQESRLKDNPDAAR